MRVLRSCSDAVVAAADATTALIIHGSRGGVNACQSFEHITNVAKLKCIQEHCDAWLDNAHAQAASVKAGIKAGIPEAEVRQAFKRISDLTPMVY